MRRHWLTLLNAAIGAFVGGALAAPLLARAGVNQAADTLYSLYHLTCHQWAFRSFFLFGRQASYSQADLQAFGVDPFGFIGSSAMGWKMAVCERDVAIYLSVLGAGLWYARHRTLEPLGVRAYLLLILPMALDGFSQLFGWRESTWELRVITGLLFGTASAWLLYPRFDASFGTDPRAEQYAPENACAPQLPTPRG